MTRPLMTWRPDQGRLRLLRIGVLGTASLLLGTAAHLVGGGMLPGAAVLVVAGFLSGLVAVALTARRCRFGILLGVLAVQQLALHVVLDAAGHAMVLPGGGHVSHLASLGATPGLTPDPMTSDPAMLIGHLAATVLTAWILARGERLLWRVADQVVALATVRTSPRRLRRLLRPALPAVRVLIASPADPGTPRRGPPLLLAAR